jgi:hypothetical protein
MLKELFQGYLDSDAYEQIRVSLIQLMEQAYQAGWTAAEGYHAIISSAFDIYSSEEEFDQMMDEIENQ